MSRPNVPPLRRDADRLQDWFEEPILRADTLKVLAPNWCQQDALVRMEITVKPPSAGAVGDLTLNTYRYFRSDSYEETLQGSVTVATAAQLNAAGAEDITFSAAVDARDLSSIMLNNTLTGVTLTGVVVYFRSPPTPVQPYVAPKVC